MCIYFHFFIIIIKLIITTLSSVTSIFINALSLNNSLLHSINYKNKQYKEMNKYENQSDEYSQRKINFTTYNKILQNLSDKQKEAIIITLDKSNRKHTWNHINAIIYNKSKSTLCQVKDQNKVLNNKQDIADRFNTFFQKLEITKSQIYYPENEFMKYMNQPIEEPFKLKKYNRM